MNYVETFYLSDDPNDTLKLWDAFFDSQANLSQSPASFDLNVISDHNELMMPLNQGVILPNVDEIKLMRRFLSEGIDSFNAGAMEKAELILFCIVNSRCVTHQARVKLIEIKIALKKYEEAYVEIGAMLEKLRAQSINSICTTDWPALANILKIISLNQKNFDPCKFKFRNDHLKDLQELLPSNLR